MQDGTTTRETPLSKDDHGDVKIKKFDRLGFSGPTGGRQWRHAAGGSAPVPRGCNNERCNPNKEDDPTTLEDEMCESIPTPGCGFCLNGVLGDNTVPCPF